MGCFDSLYFQCPKCNGIVKEQSKAGPCNLKEYSLSNAPLSVIADIQEEGERDNLSCPHCKHSLELDVQRMVIPRLKLSIGEDEDEY